MVQSKSMIVGVAVAMVAIAIGACSAPDIEGSGLDGTPGDPTTSTKSDPSTCTTSSTPALTAADPSTFPKCACAKGGAARCLPKNKIPANLSAQLDACPDNGGGVCVPDPLVKSGGAAPPTCKSPFGEGRCMSVCVPQIAQNADLLNRGEGDVCAADERCAPCQNPLENNASTGVCDIGNAAPKCADPSSSPSSKTPAPSAVACPYTGPPVVDPSTFEVLDCGSGLRCVPSTLVPAASAAMLKTCAKGLCAPEKSIAAGGQYLPKTCKALAGAEGRCLNANIPMIASQKAQLTQDACDANELCAPCFNPVDGKDTGACKSVSCDAPKEPAKTFTACCTSQGTSRAKCVPTASVPASEQGNLDDDKGTCVKGAELCVPNEMLQPSFKGPACQGSTFLTGDYTGVCLSDCLSFGFIASLGISTGSCLKGFKCAPCTNPLTGSATGAPGCPGT